MTDQEFADFTGLPLEAVGEYRRYHPARAAAIERMADIAPLINAGIVPPDVIVLERRRKT